jgi:hypothetical protein
MDDISNRTLALLLVTSIIVSLGFTLYSLNGITRDAVTGRVGSTGSGRVNLTVASSVSISLVNSAIDFGTGYVNSSKSTCNTNATLNAGANYNDTEGAADTANNCWSQTVGSVTPKGLQIENDGNVNVLLTMVGPDVHNFLNYSTSGSYPRNFSWRARDNQTACATGATLQSTYIVFNGSSQNVCSNFSYQPNANDELGIDVRLVIPVDIKPGTYSNSSIVFTAVAQN